MSSGYKLIYHKEAVKYLSKQETAVQQRIAQGLTGLLASPPVGDIRLMKGYDGLYRLRVGSNRILFEVNDQEKIIYIRAIGSRGDIYK
ncbi:Plasmid stabilization system protein [compost metagenome]